MGWIDAELCDLALETDEIAVDELGEDVLAASRVDPETVEERRVKRSVAEADSIGLETCRVE